MLCTSGVFTFERWSIPKKTDVESIRLFVCAINCAPSGWILYGISHIFFNKMFLGLIPILCEHPFAVPIEIQLVHPKSDEEILGLPLFFIGVTVFHPHLFHYTAAADVVDVMRCGDIEEPIFSNLIDNGFPGFGLQCPCARILCGAHSQNRGFHPYPPLCNRLAHCRF